MGKNHDWNDVWPPWLVYVAIQTVASESSQLCARFAQENFIGLGESGDSGDQRYCGKWSPESPMIAPWEMKMVSGPSIFPEKNWFAGHGFYNTNPFFEIRDAKTKSESLGLKTDLMNHGGFYIPLGFKHPFGAGTVSYFKVDMMDISTICVYELAEHTIQIRLFQHQKPYGERLRL